ncbi:DNA-3-methyladenine glycosylase [Rhodoligotrophos defluvii]|uniref:DNA-3-methyladenine glycosylase n=1 Tax=Rhodoligotrophos defluvii TaxID=2561934 RepID=UPI0010C9373C|nr:DNA-3-methyladenine glycosylase [Rhodoligotrophos defluvii]
MGKRLLGRGFFARNVVEVARDLIGATLLVDGVGGMIVETEAYDREDPASHSYSGPTARNRVMFGEPGHAYIYRSYGIHWCVNFVCRSGVGDGLATGAAVLIRAIEPTQGIAAMVERRGLSNPLQLCAGPGRVCQALGLSIAHNGLPLDEPPFLLLGADAPQPIASGPRIGISKGVETPWRFGLRGSRYLSKRFASVPVRAS